MIGDTSTQKANPRQNGSLTASWTHYPQVKLVQSNTPWEYGHHLQTKYHGNADRPSKRMYRLRASSRTTWYTGSLLTTVGTHVRSHIHGQIEKAFKIVLLTPGLTWIIHGLNFDESWTIRTVYAGEKDVVSGDLTGTDRITKEFELQELVKILKDSNLTPPLPYSLEVDKEQRVEFQVS